MYKRVHGSVMIQRVRDGAFIPPDEDNRDYQEFLRLGASLLEPDPLPEVPRPIDIHAVLEVMADLLGVPVAQILARAEQKATKR